MKCPYRFIESKEPYNTREGYVVRRDFQNCLREECSAYIPEQKVGQFIVMESCAMAKRGNLEVEGIPPIKIPDKYWG